jgi:hypothetical protein
MNASVELRQTLDRVGGRVRRLRLWGGLAVCWAACALVGIVAVVSRTESVAPRDIALLLAAVAVAVGVTWWLIVGRMARDPRWLARRVEAKNPDLSAALLAAVEQEPTPDGRLGFLQSSVIESALAHSRTHDWDQAVPRSRLNAIRAVHWLAFAGLVCAIFLLDFLGFLKTEMGNPRAYTNAAAASGLAVEVEPGNAEIERGTSLVVIAKFPAAVPPEATLVVEGANAKPMARNLDDPAFAGHVPAVDAPLSYHVEFPGGRSDTFRVTVYEHPELRRVNSRLVFPTYTGLDPKDVQDVRHISAVEGTEITLLCQMNKAVAAAVLLDEKKRELPLVLHDAEQHVYRTTLKPAESQRYQVKLTDADGRANKLPADISVRVTRNLPPVVTVPRPGRDSRVSPIEELPLKAEVKDDFGLVRYGVSVSAFGQPPTEVVLGEPVQPNVKKAQPEHLIDFEALKAQPDQMVAYYFWAEDIGPDGKRRRTSGDMYFAEVRHFEEIFRQGEQQTREQQERQQQQQQGMGGNAEQADQLAELQKQIVNATWRLIRRETGSTPTDQFADDVKLVRESQQALIEKAEALGEKIQNPASAEHLRQAIQFMTTAEKQLAEGTVPGLPAALASEQAAYQALLKLRAREFEVTRQNSRQRQQGNRGANSRSPSQRQLNQLDLTDEQNRYETQSAARAQQERQAQRDREQRENQDLADRLKELARRQNDLTDRVKELQSALEQAKDEKRKEELQQQLKRLRDQQQQVLRDTDELQQRMEQEQNRDRLSDARQQVEQSRENVRQAAEALEKGQLGQAVNDGTRAGRQLDAVRDQLRKESANRFGEEMRELRGQARQLDEEQQKLTKQLDEMKQTPKPGLSDGGEKAKAERGLAEQKKQLDTLTERLQKTVQEAEQPEPVLAQELYNTVRGAAEEKVGDAIDLARRLSAAGGTADAAEASRKAGQGTERLRKGVEKAAEGVLGGQTEALKRAQRELEELAGQVNREVAQATGQPQPVQQRGDKPSEQQRDQKGQPGERQPGQQPGQGEQQRQPGQQPGQGQPGQQQQPGERGQPGGQRRNLTDPPERNQPGGERLQQGPQTGGARGGPIREEGFREWYDRMRATEDLLDDPKLRAEAARIRDRVRTTREEFKRHAKEPDWKQLQEMVAKPLNELRDRVAEEVRKRDTPDALVPIDRDPVPPEFVDGVRRYYERLGSGR